MLALMRLLAKPRKVSTFLLPSSDFPLAGAWLFSPTFNTTFPWVPELAGHQSSHHGMQYPGEWLLFPGRVCSLQGLEKGERYCVAPCTLRGHVSFAVGWQQFQKMAHGSCGTLT